MLKVYSKFFYFSTKYLERTLKTYISIITKITINRYCGYFVIIYVYNVHIVQKGVKY